MANVLYASSSDDETFSEVQDNPSEKSNKKVRIINIIPFEKVGIHINNKPSPIDNKELIYLFIKGLKEYTI